MEDFKRKFFACYILKATKAYLFFKLISFFKYAFTVTGLSDLVLFYYSELQMFMKHLGLKLRKEQWIVVSSISNELADDSNVDDCLLKQCYSAVSVYELI